MTNWPGIASYNKMEKLTKKSNGTIEEQQNATVIPFFFYSARVSILDTRRHAMPETILADSRTLTPQYTIM